MALEDMLAAFRRDQQFMANVVAWRTLPAQEARLAPIPPFLHPALVQGLERRGIGALYTHQAEAAAHARAGQNVAVVTPTASGKTLAYHLPVLDALLADPQARALYLYPTKALTQDQLAALRAWQPDLPGALALPQSIAVYDGDTPSAERARVRRAARVLLSNPDMLHAGILPAHAPWADFFAGLRYVVIDELHTYRGVFGSHVANVLRRLRRICAAYGSRPQFLCTSATIANPQELAERLIEQPVEVVAQSGAPRGEKHVILYNPPMYDAEHGLRRSALLECQALAAQCVLDGVQTIVFGRTRLTTELLLTYLRDTVARGAARAGASINPQQAVRGYRGGYLPAERRAIEAGLRSGAVRAVAATNALELGIDIGALQAALLCGYPGSIAAAWQQMGRAGRTREHALAILVATGLPIDQYLMRHPEFLFERSPEHALVNPDNLMLLVDQMRCAVAELPFAAGERYGGSPYTAEVLALLAEQGEVQWSAGPDAGDAARRALYSGMGSPARALGLRSAGGDSVLIQVEDSGARAQIIGQVDPASAPSVVHEGAVYLHEGATYLVTRFDPQQQIAAVAPADVDFYTAVDRDVTLDLLATHATRTARGAAIGHGDVRVQSQVTGYRRIKRFTHETLGRYPLDYPPGILETSGYWIGILPETQEALAAAGAWYDSVNDYGPNWQEQRAAVRARDRFRCTQCGAPEPPDRQHDVHHLTPFRTFGYVPGRNEAYREANRLENLLLVCRTCHQRLERAVRTRGALDGLGYALLNLAPLYLMCDRGDLGLHVARADRARAGPSEAGVTLYEQIPAGLGFSVRLYELHEELQRAARDLIAACPCTLGCPACVGPVLDTTPLETKRLTLALLAELA